MTVQEIPLGVMGSGYGCAKVSKEPRTAMNPRIEAIMIGDEYENLSVISDWDSKRRSIASFFHLSSLDVVLIGEDVECHEWIGPRIWRNIGWGFDTVGRCIVTFYCERDETMSKEERRCLRKLRRCDELRGRIGEISDCSHNMVNLSYWYLDKASATAFALDDNHSNWGSMPCQAVIRRICWRTVIVRPAMLLLFIASMTAEFSHIKATLQPIHSTAHNMMAKKIAYISFQLICFLRYLWLMCIEKAFSPQIPPIPFASV